MTLREEVLKNSGIAATIAARTKAAFEKKKTNFEKELNNLTNQYDVELGFGYISPEDDDEIIIYDKRKNSDYKAYLNTDTEASEKMNKDPKNKEAKERIDSFIHALHSLESKYGLDFAYGYVDTGDDDSFIVYDTHHKAYINV